MTWAATGRLRFVPYDARTMTQARASGRNITEEDMSKYEMPDNIIGSTVEVKITNLPGSGMIKGKVDTGATICSLHAEKWSIDNDVVKFVCPELSQNVISAPLVDQQAVKSSDGGTEYRPVITLNIKINGKLLNDIQFNLNNRGQMEFPILIGQNALEKGRFLINPMMNENGEFDWKIFEQAFNDFVKDDEAPEEDVDVKDDEVPDDGRAEQLKERVAEFCDDVKHLIGPIVDDSVEE